MSTNLDGGDRKQSGLLATARFGNEISTAISKTVSYSARHPDQSRLETPADFHR
jgi:hypothetical protein